MRARRAAPPHRATLPVNYREPIVLYYFQKMDLAETARILAIPEGTLKARLQIASSVQRVVARR
jgi:DNA-directed RNA polymerase specialized sigma24 family protein